MTEYMIIDTLRPYNQDAWVEAKDAKGRVTKPVRPIRDEVEIRVRVDRMFSAHLRLPTSFQDTTTKRRNAIADACTKFGLGREIAPGIQIVEMETRFTEARQAMITPEEKDEQGDIIRSESFTPAQPEKIEYSFTLRLDGLHSQKVSLTEAGISQLDWKTVLAGKVSRAEVFSR